jgi:hypothetical protein
VDAEPPRIVFEVPAPCTDASRAEGLLRRALAPARAPGAWTVSMRVEHGNAHALRAEGEIADEAGAPVAHRTLTETTAECSGLARAVGVWASLVLDAEVQRGQAATKAGDASKATTAPAAATATAADPVADPLWPAPVETEPPPPEHDWFLHHDEKQERTVELGLAAFLMTGTAGGGAIGGPSPFIVVEAGRGVFLRPALAVGQSLSSLVSQDQLRVTWAAMRMDACLRLPGMYTQHRGIQLDGCAGTDLGFTHLDASTAQAAGVPTTAQTLPYLALGPSIGLRGELGSQLAVAVRGIMGINVLKESFLDGTGAAVDSPALSGRVELALSWGLR